MTQFRQIVPNSTINIVNEAYEVYLVWLSPGAGVRSWLFSHTDGDSERSYDLFTVESDTDIRSVPSESRKEAEVLTQSLTSEDLKYVESIMASNRVYQVFKNGTRVPVALKNGSVSRANKNKEFEIALKIVYKEDDILNV